MKCWCSGLSFLCTDCDSEKKWKSFNTEARRLLLSLRETIDTNSEEARDILKRIMILETETKQRYSLSDVPQNARL